MTETFDSIVTSLTGMITDLGLWPVILVGIVVGLAGGVVRFAKKAGK